MSPKEYCVIIIIQILNSKYILNSKNSLLNKI